MKTVKFNMNLSIGYPGATHEDEGQIEVEDNATKSEIESICEEYVQEWANNYIAYGFEYVTPAKE